MSHTIKVEVEVVVDRVEGKFASRADIEEAVGQIIEEAVADAAGESLSDLGIDGDSEYEITSVSVVEVK